MYADEEVGTGQDGRPKVIAAKLDEGRLGAMGGRMTQGVQREIYDGQAHGKDPIENERSQDGRSDRAMKEAARKALAWQRTVEKEEFGLGPPSQYPTPLSRGQVGVYQQEATYDPKTDTRANAAFQATQDAHAFYHPGQRPTGNHAIPLSRRPVAESVPLQQAIRAPSGVPMISEGPPLKYKSGEPVHEGDVFVDHTGMLSRVTESLQGQVAVATPTMGNLTVGAPYMGKCKLLRRAT